MKFIVNIMNVRKFWGNHSAASPIVGVTKSPQVIEMGGGQEHGVELDSPEFGSFLSCLLVGLPP